MKKYITILFVACMMLFSAACDENPGNLDSGTDTPAAENGNALSENTADGGEQGDSTDNGEKGIPSEGEIKALYEKAEEVYQWFDMEMLDVETEDGLVVNYTLSDGTVCAKVEDDRIGSLTELKAAVHECFADEFAEELLGMGLYLEENGVLYEVQADRGADITKGNIIAEMVTNATETNFTYTISVEILDPETDTVTGSEDIDFLAEKINGTWLFTQFRPLK